MHFLIITGMSGAGKSRTLTALEDIGYYCVDNMPTTLIPAFAQIATGSEQYQRVALVTDVRAGTDFHALYAALAQIKEMGVKTQILFLDASDETLARRFKETRRKHPLLDEKRSLEQAIDKERDLLDGIKAMAAYVIDTSTFSTSLLREHLVDLFSGNKRTTIMVNVVSFGFKHGTPADADLMFDVRFLPNPYYEIRLRPKTGQDPDVRDYVFADGTAGEFLKKLTDMLDFLLPRYIYEGKISLVVAIGCTGGKHRSVALTEAIAAHIKQAGYKTVITHRDKGKL